MLMNLNLIIQLCLIISFLFYGLSCFLSPHIIEEFQRYGMPSMRKLTGVLQICSSLGLIVGFFISGFALAASFLLTMMMLVALVVRLRLRDNFFITVPALFYFILSLFLLIAQYKILAT